MAKEAKELTPNELNSILVGHTRKIMDKNFPPPTHQTHLSFGPVLSRGP